MATPDGAITLSDGTWVLMDELHGRDFRFLMGLDENNLAPKDIDRVFDVIEKRCLRASVPDVIDLRISLLMEIVTRWMGGVEEQALPPAIAPGSAKHSQPRRSTSGRKVSRSTTRSTNSASAGASTRNGSTS